MGGLETKHDVSSFDEGINRLIKFAATRTGHSYALLSKTDEGKLKVTEKSSKPCYGELRPYGKYVNPKQKNTRGKDVKPNDLPHGFPEGEILALSVAMHQPVAKKTLESELWDVFWSKELSPWREALGSHQIVLSDDADKNPAHLWTDANFAPTTAISSLMVARNINEYSVDRFDILKKLAPNSNPSFLIAATLCSSFYGTWSFGNQTDYELSFTDASLSRFVNGKPFDLDEGLTLRERAAYNRPNIQYLFGFGYGVLPVCRTPEKFLDMFSKSISDIPEKPHALDEKNNLISPIKNLW